jgi:hypothetical protein
MKQLADLKAPAPIVKRLLEKDVQRMCVDWARARGYWARKFSSMTQNSVPDYLFARRWIGQAFSIRFYCEFKAPNVKPRHSTTNSLPCRRLAGTALSAMTLRSLRAGCKPTKITGSPCNEHQ